MATCDGNHDEKNVGYDMENQGGKCRTVYHKVCRRCGDTWDIYGDWY